MANPLENGKNILPGQETIRDVSPEMTERQKEEQRQLLEMSRDEAGRLRELADEARAKEPSDEQKVEIIEDIKREKIYPYFESQFPEGEAVERMNEEKRRIYELLRLGDPKEGKYAVVQEKYDAKGLSRLEIEIGEYNYDFQGPIGGNKEAIICKTDPDGMWSEQVYENNSEHGWKRAYEQRGSLMNRIVAAKPSVNKSPEKVNPFLGREAKNGMLEQETEDIRKTAKLEKKAKSASPKDASKAQGEIEKLNAKEQKKKEKLISQEKNEKIYTEMEALNEERPLDEHRKRREQEPLEVLAVLENAAKKEGKVNMAILGENNRDDFTTGKWAPYFNEQGLFIEAECEMIVDGKPVMEMAYIPMSLDRVVRAKEGDL